MYGKLLCIQDKNNLDFTMYCSLGGMELMETLNKNQKVRDIGLQVID